VVLQLDAFVLVLQQELSLVAEIAVDDVDERLAEVGELEEKSLLHLLEVAVGNLVHAGLRIEVVEEQLVLAAEILGEIVVDEGHIRAVLAHLEDLLATQPRLPVPARPLHEILAVVELLPEAPLVPALPDVAVPRDPQLAGVPPAAPAPERAGVWVGGVARL